MQLPNTAGLTVKSTDRHGLTSLNPTLPKLGTSEQRGK